MRTRSSSNLIVESSTIPKRRNRRCSKQIVIVETSFATMADTRTMSESTQAPTEGYEDDPHSHIRWFNKITSTLKYKNVPHDAIKLMLFPFSLEGAAQIWLEKEPPRSIYTWEDLRFDETFSEAWDRFKDLLRKCPHHGFLELHQIDTFYNALTQSDQDSLNAACTRQSPSGLGSLPSDTVANPRGDKGQGANYKFRKYRTRPTFGYSSFIPEPDVAPKPNPKPLIPYPSRLNDQKLREKANNQMLKFLQIFQRLHFDLSFADSLLHMHEFDSTFKSLLSNKEKLFELANTPLNGDPGKFLIPCDFPELDECLALADLGASINLMPISVWKKLSLPELTPTRMTLRNSQTIGLLIWTTPALIDVHGEELTLQVNDEAIPFNVGHTSRYSYRYDDESVNRIDVIDVTCEEYAQEVLGFSDSSKSGNPTPSSDPIITTSSPSLTPFEGGDFVLEEIKACHTSDSIPPGIDDADFDLEGDIILLEKLLNDDPSSPLPPKELNFEELKIIKSSIDDPPKLELKDLPSHLEYAFLERKLI
ncbi:hypothetical protein Tco_1090163 [Tanacetum coccineum]|uniref:Reverse transcriptase domain-containing protein n=1 Tax=Tanacetum coccineum TaxID=301880 RepID=A0ABQ5I3H2_9ASTR